LPSGGLAEVLRRSRRCAPTPTRSSTGAGGERPTLGVAIRARRERMRRFARTVAKPLLHEDHTAVSARAGDRSRPNGLLRESCSASGRRRAGREARRRLPRRRKCASCAGAAGEDRHRASALSVGAARAVAEARPAARECGDHDRRGIAAPSRARTVSRVAELERALQDGGGRRRGASPRTFRNAAGRDMEIVAVPARADARDAMCGASSLMRFPPGPTSRVGTRSLRPTALMLPRDGH